MTSFIGLERKGPKCGWQKSDSFNLPCRHFPLTVHKLACGGATFGFEAMEYVVWGVVGEIVRVSD